MELSRNKVPLRERGGGSPPFYGVKILTCFYKCTQLNPYYLGNYAQGQLLVITTHKFNKVGFYLVLEELASSRNVL